MNTNTLWHGGGYLWLLVLACAELELVPVPVLE